MLNNDFYDTAFMETEKGSIQVDKVVNANNPIWGTEYGSHGGNDTMDKVWLLSLGEIERYFHIPMTRDTTPYFNGALNYSWEEYALYCYNQDHRVIAGSTAYAQARGCWTLTDGANYAEGYDFSHAKGGGWWWLSSPGGYCDNAAYVSHNGYVIYDGSYVDEDSLGVRPTLKLRY